VDASALERVEDVDARDNYRVLLAFLGRLKRAASVESCYLEIFSGSAVDVPPLFVDQLAQIVIRNILDGCEDPLEPRAGELFFREQKASTDDGTVMLADLETVEMHASGNRFGSIGRLIVEAQGDLAKVDRRGSRLERSEACNKCEHTWTAQLFDPNRPEPLADAVCLQRRQVGRLSSQRLYLFDRLALLDRCGETIHFEAKNMSLLTGRLVPSSIARPGHD